MSLECHVCSYRYLWLLGIKGASQNYFAEDNVIVTLRGEGIRAVTLSSVETSSLFETYVPC